MASKEKSPIDLLEELVVKFGQIFSSDMYIYKRKFCVPGVNTSDNLLGDVILTLEGKWENVLSELGIPDVYYIDDVKGFRAKFKDKTITVEELHKEYGDPSTETTLIEEISDVTSEHEKETNVWTPISKIPNLITTLFDDKLIYLYQIENGDAIEEISIAKQMFPMMTIKTAIDAYIIIEKSKDYDGLYDILIDFNHSHFRVQSVYHALSTPKVG